MLYIVRNKEDIDALGRSVPRCVTEELLRGTTDDEVDGISWVAETNEDLLKLKRVFDYDTRICEWATRIGESGEYVAALYLRNNEETLMLFVPTVIVPIKVLRELED